nr:ASKHA domain-containing protein [Labrenzia sp. PHM005]
MALLNRGYRRKIETTVHNIEKIETALEPKFQEHFVNAMSLPNKVDPIPNLRAGGDGGVEILLVVYLLSTYLAVSPFNFSRRHHQSFSFW